MLPKNLRYGSKVESAPAKSYRSNIQPQNGTGPYNLGDTIIFNIPTRSNLVLCPSDSYLKWTVQSFTTAAANSLRWDKCGSHGLIQRIRVYHGSNLLQDLDVYGNLTKILFDLQCETDATYNKLNILCGTRNDLVVTTNAVAAVGAGLAVPAVPVTYLSAQQINSGEGIPKANGNVVLAANDTTTAITYCLNLVSIVGSLCPNNYLPLFAMTAAPLRVEIQLISQDYYGLCEVAATTHAAGVVTNVEYIASMIELGDQSMQMIESSLEGRPLQFVYGDYRNYQYTYALPSPATTQVSFPIPAKFSSLKSIFLSQRDKGTGALGYFPFSSVTYGLYSYYWRIGPQIIPSKPPDDIVSFYSELLKSVGVISDLQFNPSIRKTNYLISSSTANTTALEANTASNTNSGSVYVGIDLENFTGASKDSIFAGWNSNTDDIYFVGNYNTANGSATNYTGADLAAATIRFDAYAMYDCVFICENGTAYVKY